MRIAGIAWYLQVWGFPR